MFKSFLIKYAEIGVKGKNRYLFENALVDNAKRALDKIDGNFKVTKENGRIYAIAEGDYDFDEAVDALQHVFGIVGICPMVQIEDNGFDDLAEQVIKYIDETYPDKNFTFKVMARRARKNYPMDSMKINAELGGRILDAFEGVKVDVHNPEDEGRCPSSGNHVKRGNQREDLYLFKDYSGTRWHAGRNSRKGDVAFIRWY